MGTHDSIYGDLARRLFQRCSERRLVRLRKFGERRRHRGSREACNMSWLGPPSKTIGNWYLRTSTSVNPSVDSESNQRVRIGEPPGTAFVRICDVRAENLSQGIGQSEERRAVLDGAPNGDAKLSARAQDPAHFNQCRDPIRKELKALLTRHQVNDAIGDTKCVRRAF